MSEHPGGGAGPPRFASARAPRFTRGLARALAVWGSVLLGGWTLWVARQPLDPDYTAGELLDHVMAWGEGAPLYPPLTPLPPARVLNYPPVALLVARAMTVAGVPPLAAGRLATAAGVALLLAGVAWWARSRGAHGTSLAGTLGMLAGSFPLLYASGQFHVEPWATAGVLWGAALLDRPAAAPGDGPRDARPPVRRGVAIAAGLALALGCLAKQTAVVPSLVVLGWGARHHRAAWLPALGGWLLGGIAAAAAMTAAWGLEPWRHLILYTVGTPDPANLGWQLLRYVAPWGILLGWSAVAALRHRDRGSPDLLPVLLAGTALWSCSAMRAGASFGYFLDLQVLAALWAGPHLFAHSGPRWPDGVPLRPAVALLLVAQVVGATIGTTAALGVNVARRRGEPAALAALCQQLGPGPLLAEEAGVARACGASAQLHPFIMTSLARQGRWDAAPFERALAAGQWPVAVLPFDPRLPVPAPHRERWSPAMLEAFRTAPLVAPAGAGRWLVRWPSAQR